MKTSWSNLLWLWGGLILIGSGCNIINQEEPIPSYIYVKPFRMESNPQITHGSLSQKVTQGNVFVNGKTIGIFSLPALIPVLEEGTQEVIIDPLIRDNGLTFTLQVYPFYERFTTSVDLTLTETDTIQPVTRYSEDITFHLIEDFEGGSNVFSEDRDMNNETLLDTTQIDAFEGEYSGMIVLNLDNPLMEVASNADQLFDIFDRGKVYLEMDYKTEVDVLIGMIGIDNIGNDQSNYEYGLVPKSDWNKIYFNLTNFGLVNNLNGYQIGITAALPVANGDFTLDEGTILIDNVKLISF